MPADAWTLGGNASIDPVFAAPKSPGRLAFGVCVPNTRAQQTFAMPAFADAEPLAFEVSTLNADLDFDTLIGLNRRYRELFIRGTGRICAGENAYGGDVALSFIPNCRAYQTTQPVDHVVLVPAPECPAIATVLNGSFEENGGWKAEQAGAEITAGAGTNGSRAGHLTVATGCESAKLSTDASVPGKSRANAAIEMTVKGTNGGELFVSLGSGGTAAGYVGSIAGKGIYEKVRMCVPEFARGLVMPLGFEIHATTAGVCGDPVPATEFFLDDIAFVSDASCVDPGWVLDGGFEGADLKRQWLISGVASVGHSTSEQPSGARPLFMDGCGNPRVRQFATIPDAAPGAGGAQVRFWYRAESMGGTATFKAPAEDVPAAASWTQRTRCIASAEPGLSYGIEFGYSTGGACSSVEMFVDDVEIVHDPSCPE
jgi:hypothetical protein